MRTVDPERHAARRSAILEAAAGVFATHGYDGATTAGICRAAGIGSGTLFHYFGDKRSIFVALFADDVTASREILATLDHDRPEAEIWRLLDHLTRDIDDPLAPGFVWAALQLATRDDEFGALLAEGDAEVRNALAGLLARAGFADPFRKARWLHALVDTLYLMCGDDGFDADAERVELRLIAERYLRRTA